VYLLESVIYGASAFGITWMIITGGRALVSWKSRK
jgi:hypothetical protein